MNEENEESLFEDENRNERNLIKDDILDQEKEVKEEHEQKTYQYQETIKEGRDNEESKENHSESNSDSESTQKDTPIKARNAKSKLPRTNQIYKGKNFSIKTSDLFKTLIN